MPELREAVRRACELKLNALCEPGNAVTLWGLAEECAAAALAAIEASGILKALADAADVIHCLRAHGGAFDVDATLAGIDAAIEALAARPRDVAPMEKSDG